MMDYELNERLYPSVYPTFPGEPTRSKFCVVKTENKAEGLRVLTPFKKGEMVFAFTGITLPYQNLYTLQYRHNLFIYDPYVMGKVLHSCDPNLDCHMYDRTFWAKRDIEAGEFLTMDYEQTEDVLYQPFTCLCGSDKCRGAILGRKVPRGV